jgi:hypothetical protein
MGINNLVCFYGRPFKMFTPTITDAVFLPFSAATAPCLLEAAERSSCRAKNFPTPQIIPMAAARSTDISLPDSAKKDKQIYSCQHFGQSKCYFDNYYKAGLREAICSQPPAHARHGGGWYFQPLADKAIAHQYFKRCTCNPASAGFVWQETDSFLTRLPSTAPRQNPRPLGRGVSQLLYPKIRGKLKRQNRVALPMEKGNGFIFQYTARNTRRRSSMLFIRTCWTLRRSRPLLRSLPILRSGITRA